MKLTIRNNINGDFINIEKLSDVKAGSFININWKDKSLMLPLSLRKGFLSFSDLKWDWIYIYNENGKLNEEEPILYEILSFGKNIKHNCKSNKIDQIK